VSEQPFRVEVRGVDELVAALPRYENHVWTAAKAAARVAAEHTSDQTQARLPRRSGRLAGSVRVAKRKGSRQRVSMGKARVPYAGFIEFGGIRGRPFMREGRYLFPASERSKDLFLRVATQETAKATRGFRWPRP
jgi:ribosomal protein L4